MKKIIAIGGFLGFFASQVITSSAAYFDTTPVVSCQTQITKTLQIGSDNNDVYVLQNMLVNAGFLNASPNGHYGRQTATAVRAFQISNGISPTGRVGESTRNAVNERLCDTDLVDNNISSYNDGYREYAYSDGTTYVGQVDPYVKVITPSSDNPSVYATPQNLSRVITSNHISANGYNSSPLSSFSSNPIQTAPSASSVFQPAYSNSSTNGQIASTGIVYNPSTGYSYGIVPKSGSVTVSSPVANSVYQEGDTVTANWTSNNISVAPYTILLESTITGQSKVVAILSGNTYSFILTKELLDSVCAGTCNNNQQGSFRIVITMPTTDIAGITSTLRAAVAPITIRRPLALGQVTISSSKTPVTTGEIFKLYINVPTTSTLWNTTLTNNYSVKIKATCGGGVSASIAGVPCGQEFTIPPTVIASQQEIPAMITNTSWYKQDVTFAITVVNLTGQTIGVASTVVTVNAAPFGW